MTLTAGAQYQATNRAMATLAADFVMPDQPADWPLPGLTDAELAGARDCDIETLYQQRYEKVSDNDMPGQFPLDTSCDWAVLAAAYSQKSYASDKSRPLPAIAYEAFYRAVSSNRAFLLKNWLSYDYFGSMSLVKAPALSKEPVTNIEMHYSFGGIGYSNDVQVHIAQADTKRPAVSGHVTENIDAAGPHTPAPHTTNRALYGTVDPALVRGLGKSLTNLIPIDAPFDAIACEDFYPAWEVKLTYQDGTQLDLNTMGNLLGSEGPWHVVIDGKDYIQHGYEIASAVSQIAEALKIPGGETAAVFCGGSGRDMLDLAFPNR